MAVLRELLSLHPDLLPDTRRAANALLARVSFTDIAKSVFDALLALDLDDLDAGQRAGGYVEPSEAAWEAIKKVVAPFFHDPRAPGERGPLASGNSSAHREHSDGPSPIAGKDGSFCAAVAH